MVSGLTFPHLSEHDPPVAGEGSIDPLGLAPASDRLADFVAPHVRNRMRHIRFVTATAVGAVAWESFINDVPADGTSTPAICFEWLVLEAFLRRRARDMPTGVPGVLKAQTVLERDGRLDAGNYLKTPPVFGFTGVHKPLSVGMGVVNGGLLPAERCMQLASIWADEQDFSGYVDGARGTVGGRLRDRLETAIEDSLSSGHCAPGPKSPIFDQLACGLMPTEAGPRERKTLRAWLCDESVPVRRELARLLRGTNPDKSEAALLATVRPRASENLGLYLDAIAAYERLSTLLDVAFRQMRYLSTAMGSTPLTPVAVKDDATLARCAADMPAAYVASSDSVARLPEEVNIEELLGAFADQHGPGELVGLIAAHHEGVQDAKRKRPWFEPYRDGHVVRLAYREPARPQLTDEFIHPIRLKTLSAFMETTSP